MKITLKPSRIPLTVVALAVAPFFIFAITTTALAGMGGGDKNKNKMPNDSSDTRVLVQSVDPVANIVVFQTMKDKSTHLYKVDAGTSITVNNNPGTFSNIKAGMEVTSSTERDSTTLDAISVGVASPAPSSPLKSKGKKNSSGSM